MKGIQGKAASLLQQASHTLQQLRSLAKESQTERLNKASLYETSSADCCQVIQDAMKDASMWAGRRYKPPDLEDCMSSEATVQFAPR